MIEAFYSCVVCGLVKRPIFLHERESEKDVIEWMEEVKDLVCQDHRLTSSRCQATHITDLLIPIEGAGWLGGPVKLLKKDE